ncbi:hypothetical protein BG011_003004 [Mortierella polycephala]|uniref:Kinetochore protein Mis13/DSN1 n=1 Tax=Mortierella polycephala TaxID=41804 RepID=A0A9P6Q1Y4_9FUNG|nr:hypothetical protein BG011_003004 [Mortierella polycephala]
MPPRRGQKGAVATKPAAVARAKKRKNADRSEDDDDSDFDYTHQYRIHHQKVTHSKPNAHSSTSRQQYQQAVPLHTSLDNPSLNIAPMDSVTRARAFPGEKESWRAELSEMKRAKRFTEEDRGFVFTRKKTATTSSGIGLSSKPAPFTNGTHDIEPSVLASPNPPPTPERTPSKDKGYDRRVPVTNGANGSRRRNQPQLQQQEQPRRQYHHTPERNSESIVVIPLRETPMIQKNKDMRGANRRSSLVMRGKRASSIGNGFHTQPHPSIDPRTFFRHISADEPPPIRMKQLMAWCARKTIDSQNSRSQSALKLAKQIEEEALTMLIAGRFSVSWYSRPLDTEPIRVVPKKPHQQNVDNLRKLKECEAQIAKLRKEDEEWTRVISTFNTFHAALLDNGLPLPPGDEAIIMPDSVADDLEVEMLTSDEKSLWEKYCKDKDSTSTPGSAVKSPRNTADAGKKSSKETNKWMVEMMSTLEKEVDTLQDTLYAASRLNKVAKQYTDQVLEQIATALDERQRPPASIPLLAAASPSTFALLPSASTSAPVPPSTLAVAPAANISSDIADDPRQILRALSRLSI